MAWGSQGQVFLGEDLMHTRDYSDDTSKVIDDEVERILREQEERAIEVLSQHRAGLDAVARALLATRSSTGPRSAGWSTRPTAGRSTRGGEVRPALHRQRHQRQRRQRQRRRPRLGRP